ncbi:hypothetical protein BGZ98_009250 [Dissophora globulifera]|nr:hypothetical protein BGZ98_009250 [Dissophora globulifera]
MEIDTEVSAGSSASQQTKATTLTRLCHGQSEHHYIYLTVEMESRQGSTGTSSKKATAANAATNPLSILTFRKMLSSAVQDLFGATMGGGINIDILGYWTDWTKDPYNRLIIPPNAATIELTAVPTIPSSSATTSSTASSSKRPTATLTSTYSPLTAASAILRCHSIDFNQLWNGLTLFNTLVDDCESRFEVRYVSSTLLGLQANSRQLRWPN